MEVDYSHSFGPIIFPLSTPFISSSMKINCEEKSEDEKEIAAKLYQENHNFVVICMASLVSDFKSIPQHGAHKTHKNNSLNYF